MRGSNNCHAFLLQSVDRNSGPMFAVYGQKYARLCHIRQIL